MKPTWCNHTHRGFSNNVKSVKEVPLFGRSQCDKQDKQNKQPSFRDRFLEWDSQHGLNLDQT
jgi:hypothetical protein